MRRSHLFLTAVFLSLSACSIVHNRALNDDFIDSGFPEDPADLPEAIEKARDEIRRNDKDPAFHRRLSILYRMEGTPYSRKKSLQEIDIAISLHPDDPLNHVEKGLTFQAMQFTGDAQRSLREAISIDPGCFPAWYHLARIEKEKYLRNMCFDEQADDAIRYYRKAYNINDSHEDAIFNLGILNLLRNNLGEARRYALHAAELHPANPRNHLLAGSVHLRSKEFVEAESEFKAALDLMDPEQRGKYIDASLLLPPGEAEEHITWSDDKRTEWNIRFWLMNDPTPATEINERLLEHFDRVFLATELLTNKRLELAGDETARGEAIIKYGLPDRMVYRLGERWDGPVVVWDYSGEGSSFRLFFQDEFLNGNYHIPIDRRFSGIAGVTQSVLNNVHQAYRYPVESVDLPMFAEAAQRRGNGGKTLIEFSIAVPDSAISRPKESYGTVISIFDSDLSRITNEVIPFLPDTAIHITRLGTGYRVFTFGFELLPRIFECTYAIEITGGMPFARGVYRDAFTIKDLSGGSLCSSTIKLSLHGGAAACTDVPDPIPFHESGARLCVAYEIYNLERDYSGMSRYRLTYSIKDPQEIDENLKGLRRTLAYIKRSVQGGKGSGAPYISSSFVQGTGALAVSDMLEIDTGVLEPGNYILTLVIDDLNSGESISQEKRFAITSR